MTPTPNPNNPTNPTAPNTPSTVRDATARDAPKSPPDSVRDLDHLEDLLSDPSPGVIDTLGRLQGDVIVLGVGGKMGPSLARMARRASDAAGVRRRVIGVSRFSEGPLRAQLEGWGVETIPADLLDPAQIDALPDAPLVVYLAGMKFGSTGQQARTWAMNAYLPGMACHKFRGAGWWRCPAGTSTRWSRRTPAGATRRRSPARWASTR